MVMNDDNVTSVDLKTMAAAITRQRKAIGTIIIVVHDKGASIAVHDLDLSTCNNALCAAAYHNFRLAYEEEQEDRSA
jgi:hypothetical protein